MIYNNRQDIRQIIKQAARSRGFTLAEIARRMGILPQELNDRFLRKSISLDTMRDICAVFGCVLDVNVIDKPSD